METIYVVVGSNLESNVDNRMTLYSAHREGEQAVNALESLKQKAIEEGFEITQHGQLFFRAKKKSKWAYGDGDENIKVEIKTVDLI